MLERSEAIRGDMNNAYLVESHSEYEVRQLSPSRT